MKLGIVGHAQDKFTVATEAAARAAIRGAIKERGAMVVVSGRCPLGGVDIYAEQIAGEMSVATEIYPPSVRCWSGPGGYKERNLRIARASDLVLVVVVRALPEGFSGMRFGGCYHCRGRNPLHVKSGGCWTAWQARKQEWIIL